MNDIELASKDYVDSKSGSSYQYITETPEYLYLGDGGSNVYLGFINGYVNIGDMGARQIDVNGNEINFNCFEINLGREHNNDSIFINGPAKFNNTILDKNGNEITGGGGGSSLQNVEDMSDSNVYGVKLKTYTDGGGYEKGCVLIEDEDTGNKLFLSPYCCTYYEGPMIGSGNGSDVTIAAPLSSGSWRSYIQVFNGGINIRVANYLGTTGKDVTITYDNIDKLINLLNS